MERWKPLEYENLEHYSISNRGRLMNTENDTVLKMRVQKKTSLVFCDISKTLDNGEKIRKTIYITHEVAKAFVPKPKDFDSETYLAVHKKGKSKLDNLPRNIEWRTQSEISSENMKNAGPEQRNRLANFNKEKFKDYPKKKYIRKKTESNLEKELKKEKEKLEQRIKLIDELLKTADSKKTT